MAFWSSLTSIRWVSILLTIVKWGSVIAVVGYLGWNVINNYKLRDDITRLETEIEMVEASNQELLRRMNITEGQLTELQENRTQTRRELEETLRLIRELDLNSTTTNPEEVEEIINELWERWLNEAENISQE